MSASTTEIAIKDLLDSRNLSYRAFSVCQRLRFSTVRDLSIFILRNKGLIKEKGCGAKTQKELLEIHEHFLPELLGIPKQFRVDTLLKKIPLVKKTLPLVRRKTKDKNFTVNSFEAEPIPLDQLVITENYQGYDEKYIKILVEEKFEKLRVRSKNALLRFFDEQIPGKAEILNYFILHKFPAHKLRNVGSKTVIEIESFVNDTVEIYNTIKNEGIPQTELAKIKLDEATGKKINDPVLLDKISKNEMSLISFTSEYLRDILDLKEIQEFIIKNHFGLLDTVFSPDEIAKRYSVCRAHILQIRRKTLKNAQENLSKLLVLIPFSKYETAFNNRNIISFPEGISDEHINSEIEKTGALFSGFILSALLKSTYYCISPNHRIEKPGKVNRYEIYNTRKQFKGTYFIKKAILTKEVFLTLYKKVFGLLCLRQKEELRVDINSLIQTPVNTEITDVIKFILEKELEIPIEGDFIVIPRNTRKLMHEHAVIALEHIGKPSHINDIFAAVKTAYPGFKYSARSLQSAITSRRKIFISISRTNTFGLRSWESKYENIKGGSINDIVSELLGTMDNPCHISEIIQYVSRFRSVKINSIITILRSSKNKRFVLFKDGSIGLTSKKYAKRPIKKGNANKRYTKQIDVDSGDVLKTKGL